MKNKNTLSIGMVLIISSILILVVIFLRYNTMKGDNNFENLLSKNGLIYRWGENVLEVHERYARESSMIYCGNVAERVCLREEINKFWYDMNNLTDEELGFEGNRQINEAFAPIMRGSANCYNEVIELCNIKDN